MRSVKLLVILAAAAVYAPAADMSACSCDFSTPGGAAKKECGLSMIAHNEPTWEMAFLLKDNSVEKPHQWLAMPKGEYGGAGPLSLMKDNERLALWSVAAQKAKDLFGADWALAMNGTDRSQCHLHIHIGKMKPASEKGGGIFVDDLSEIPLPQNGNGIWVHPQGGKLHVHTDAVATEYVLEQ